MRATAWVILFGVSCALASVGCGGSSGGSSGTGGTGQPGCTKSPDCNGCSGCLAKCLCTTQDSSACQQACAGGTGGGGGSGGTPACGSSNCAGCCFNGACQTGSTNAACGKSGATCQACVTWQTCSQDQSCTVDPDSTWNVIAVSTTLPTTDPSGAEWDVGGGAPDPYAQCQISSATVGTTGTVSDQFSATWNQVICPSVKASVLMTGQAWSICVWDADLTSDDLAGCWPTIFGEADFAAAMAGQTTQQGLVNSGTPTGGKLTLRLAKQ